jgi:hypothetical protein
VHFENENYQYRRAQQKHTLVDALGVGMSFRMEICVKGYALKECQQPIDDHESRIQAHGCKACDSEFSIGR